MYQFRQTLPNAPLDIVGDVHGEFAIFQSLLHHLGYSEDGSHPQGRKLVFVGDLCDRGPDSPAMLHWFRQAHRQGNAFMVLGNHELNILVNDPKDGSGWFFDSRAGKDGENYAPWQRADEHEKNELAAFLATQPLLLEREDIRIVHAAWLPKTFAQLEAAQNEGLIEQYHRFDSELNHYLQTASWYPDYLHEQKHFAPLAEDQNRPPPPMPATALYEFERSQSHPIRALTSGVERLAAEPFFAGGRWRGTCRCAWWDSYRDDVPVVIGHYWRHWKTIHKIASERCLLPDRGNVWHGAKRNVFCVDFSVGATWRKRKQPWKYNEESFRLAALRWPEKTLMFDNGQVVATE